MKYCCLNQIISVIDRDFPTVIFSDSIVHRSPIMFLNTESEVMTTTIEGLWVYTNKFTTLMA